MVCTKCPRIGRLDMSSVQHKEVIEELFVHPELAQFLKWLF